MIGEVFGNYRIVRQLGQGGMGAVYLAEHLRIARKAAIKVLLPQYSDEPSVLERFFAEARAASLIKHPGIVEILDSDVHQGRAFIVMELLEGESLSAMLRRVGPLRGEHVGLALEIGRLIADAVGAAHETGIVHRDLKPDNVFLPKPTGSKPGFSVKILDFGIAKLSGHARAAGAVSTTRAGTMLGTPTHMSPEQCRGTVPVDHRADVYSLGCMMFEMIAGQPPFNYEGVADLIVAHISEPPPSLIARGIEVPAAVDDLVGTMLAKAAGDRPPSMAAVAAALTEIAGGVPSVKTPPPARKPARTSLMDQVTAVSVTPTPPPTMHLPDGDDGQVRPPSRRGASAVTTLSGGSQEAPTYVTRRGPWRPLAAVAVLGVVGYGAWLGLRPSPGPAPAPKAVVMPEPARPAAPEPVPAAPRAPEPPPEQHDVRIDVEAPAGTTATLDGAPAELPLVLPSGSARHKLVLSAPGRRSFETTLVADGDRTIRADMPELAPPRPPAARPPKVAKKPPRPEAVPEEAAKPARGGDLDSLAEPSLLKGRSR
jgi:serine/threonine-protein kinase